MERVDLCRKTIRVSLCPAGGDQSDSCTEAGAGKNVLRLKGGDPFVFGRGAEEAECLREEGIEFEIIPGVTSALAVPAYAGIPITHREFASSFHVITGHAKQGRNMELPYEALVRLNGTLIFLMGITAMGEICQGLLQAGMDEICRQPFWREELHPDSASWSVPYLA